MENFKIAIAQINSHSGNFEYNAKKMAFYIKKAQSENIKILMFPEYSLIGNLMMQTTVKFPFLIEETNKWLSGLAEICSDMYVFVGFIDKYNHSAIAILNNKKIEKVISEKEPDIITIFGKKYLVVVGNNEIKTNGFIFDDIIYFNNTISQSDFKRLNTNKNGFSFYVNSVGSTDFYSCEGKSFVTDKSGNISASAKSFEEDFLVVDVNSANNIRNFIYQRSEEFNMDYSEDLERTYLIIKQGIKDYFQKCGLKRAVLGLSGGLDSTVCAVLMAEALGKENVFGISMPSSLTSNQSKSDAEILASNLGINFLTVEIGEIAEKLKLQSKTTLNFAEKMWNCRNKNSFVNDNIQARTRATILWNFSNEFEACIPVATSDKSELYMGYATINGDMSGGIAPIADVTKTKLFALADWLNKNLKTKNIIPQSIIEKRPSAELAINPKTGKILLAEEALMPYEFLDEVIWRIEKQKQSYNEMLNQIFCYEKKANVTREQKQEWLDKFFRRYSFSLYKASILPPSIITDLPSNNKSVYYQPITSSNINYKGCTEEQIKDILLKV